MERIGTYEYQDRSGTCEIYIEDASEPDNAGLSRMFVASPTNNTLVEHGVEIIFEDTTWSRQETLEEIAQLIELDMQHERSESKPDAAQ